MWDDDRKTAEFDLERAREAVEGLESAPFLDQTDLIGPRILVGRLNQYAVPIFGLTPEVVDIIDRFNQIVAGFPAQPGTLIQPVQMSGLDVPPAPPVLSIDGNEITVDGKTYVVPDRIAAFVQRLVDAGEGVWVSGPEMGDLVQPRPDRIFHHDDAFPAAIKAKIESGSKGYRLRKE
jgi:hypothetical protein